MASDIIKKIFSRLYDNTIRITKNLNTKNYENRFFIIPGKKGPKWIIPVNPIVGLQTLNQWHPYDLVSRIKWRILLYLYANGLLGKVPGIGTININSKKNLRVPHNDKIVTAVIYIGTPGPQQKAVATLVTVDNGDIQAIMKIALSDRARTSLLHEAHVLKKLFKNNILGAPELIGIEDNGSKTWQTMVNGRLTSRTLTQAHIDWLLQLPKSGKTTTGKQFKLLNKQIERDGSTLLGQKKISRLDKFSCRKYTIPIVLVHGDFAPWNLKTKTDGYIQAIDWEDALFEGLPLWDLCHFFFIQVHLFHEQNPVQKMFSNSLVKQYCAKMRLDKEAMISLTLLYILMTVFSRKEQTNESYRTFLVDRIDEVIAI